MTDRVIFENPFVCLLYPFTTDSEGITTHPFGQPVKFKFLRSPELREISNLQKVSVSKTLNPLTAKIHRKCNQAQKLDSFTSTAYPIVEFPQYRNSPQHIQHTNICASSPSHVFNKSIFENSHKIHHAHLNMFWQEKKSPTSAWKMASSSNKGKAPMQGSSFRRATSLQGLIPATITYSNGTLAITLQEVLKRTLQYCNGVYPYLPPSIKVLLDNLQRAYTKSNQNLFQRTLNALEIHLVNLEIGNIVLLSQLFGKEDVHSMDKMTIMGTNYARLGLKTQASLRSVIANLPADIQNRILQCKAMSESYDQWFAYFKILVTTHFPVYDEDSDDIDDIFLYTNWGDYYGCSLRFYEKKHPFPGLIVNFED